jgi:hypothetical protein
VFEKGGFPVQAKMEQGTYALTIDLAPDPSFGRNKDLAVDPD